MAAGQTGEVIVNSPLAMDGYWNDTAQTRKALRDGWVWTGDLARFDEEQTLLDHPAVAEGCVVGVGATVRGQDVHAFVTLRPGVPRPAEADIIRFAGERLFRPMVPARVHVAPDLPRTGAGKIDRDRLHWQAEAGPAELG